MGPGHVGAAGDLVARLLQHGVDAERRERLGHLSLVGQRRDTRSRRRASAEVAGGEQQVRGQRQDALAQVGAGRLARVSEGRCR